MLAKSKTVSSYTKKNHVKWRLMEEATEELDEANKNFEDGLHRLNDPSHTLYDVKVKNELKVVVVKELRGLVQGLIANNLKVTDADKGVMGLPVYDKQPTPVPPPSGQAEASVTFPGRAQLKVEIKHIGVLTDRKASYGCRIYYKVCAVGETPPESGMELTMSKFTRKKKEMFTFLPTDSNKIAWFCIRYENSKGEAGPWGPLASAVIP